MFILSKIFFDHWGECKGEVESHKEISTKPSLIDQKELPLLSYVSESRVAGWNPTSFMIVFKVTGKPGIQK